MSNNNNFVNYVCIIHTYIKCLPKKIKIMLSVKTNHVAKLYFILIYFYKYKNLDLYFV